MSNNKKIRQKQLKTQNSKLKTLSFLSSLRWRLTLFYLGLLAAILLVIGLFVYFALSSYLTDNTANRLYEQARSVERTGTGPGGGKSPGNGGRGLGQLYPQMLSEQVARELNSPIIYAAVLDRNGQIVEPNSRNLTTVTQIFSTPTLPGSQKVSEALASERGINYITDNRLLVYLYPARATNSSSVSALIMLATPMFQVDDTLGALRWILLLGIVGALVLGLAFGLPLARLGLRPLRRMAQTSNNIAGGDLSQRVELTTSARAGNNQDEVAQLALAFNQMLDQIEAAFEVRRRNEAQARQFAADASHELRSPLTALGGYVDVLLMQAGNDPAQRDRLLKGMRREISRMSRLVNDLLALTRLDSRHSTEVLRLEEVRLNDLVQEVVAERQLLPDAHKLHLVAPPAPLFVTGDRDWLKQVLNNLLDNAMRYTEANGNVTIRLEASDGEAVLQVKDDGIGIEPEHLPHIFDRFYRADQVRSRSTGNSGLGLAIVKSLVEAHQGKIAVDSAPGHGTTFIIKLPLSQFSQHILSEGSVPFKTAAL